MSQQRDEVFADKDEVFADKDEVFASENTYAAEIDRLVGELKTGQRKRNGANSNQRGEKSKKFILFVPLIIGVVVFLVASLIFSFPYLTRTPDKINVSLVSLEKNYDTANSNSLSDTYINAKITIANNGKEPISDVSFLMSIKNENNLSLYHEVVSFSCGFLEYIEPGDEITADVKILPFYRQNYEFVKNENYPLLWESDISQIDTSFEIYTSTFEDGKTLLYTVSWYDRNASTYFWILTLTFAVWVGWMVYCFMTRCPKCRHFAAMKPAGKKETGRTAGSSIERRAITDKYGNKIRDAKGREQYYEETVHGYNVNYTYYHRCKYCNHVTTSRGREFER